MAARGQRAPRVVAGALARAEALRDDGQGLRLPRRARVRRGKRAISSRCSTPRAWRAPRGSRATATSIPRASPMAYAAGARAGGVDACCRAFASPALERRGRRVTTVVTSAGDIEAECVINATGMWGREIAAMVGTRVPACAVEHQYFVTEKTDRIPAGLPTLRDPDADFYVKPEPGALAVGGWEPNTRPWGARRHCARLRPRAAAARFRSLRAARGGSGGAHPGAERGRDPADDQRPDPDHRRWRADHRPLARARQFLSVLRLHLGHRRVRRRRMGDGELDRRRRPGTRPVAVRRAPLRHAAFGQVVHVRARRRELRALLPHRLAELRSGRGPRRAAQSAARDAARRRRRLRQQVRLGAAQLVRRTRSASRSTCRRSSADRRSRRSAPSIAPCASASRSST